MGNPHQRIPVVHVGGTNGKGSVCAYLSTVLLAAGYRVGRYISPHLVSWCERICIDNEPIQYADFLQAIETVEGAIAKIPESPTQFEVITAAAWLYFAQQSVDIAVIEVGLGGRLDATNVVETPLVSVITSLSREHWRRLGPTLADIAWEKAGILKWQRPAVIGPLPVAAEQVVLDRAHRLNCPVLRPTPASLDPDGYAVYASEQLPDSPFTYAVSCPGRHQLTNSAIALAALHSLRDQGWQLADSAIRTGIAQTQWPGRLQWVTWKPAVGQRYPWLIDGAHNPAAAEVLRTYIDALLKGNLSPLERQNLQQQEIPLSGNGPVTWLMGMLSTKDHGDVLRQLLRPGDRLHLVPVEGHSDMAPAALAEIALSICPQLSICQSHETLAEGLTEAVAVASSVRVLCGSLYLVGHFFQTQRAYI